jgi:hypothetical protein
VTLAQYIHQVTEHNFAKDDRNVIATEIEEINRTPKFIHSSASEVLTTFHSHCCGQLVPVTAFCGAAGAMF